jgi:hypothetical protein
MEIAKQLAGFSPAEADDLRKAIGKKIHALMASLQQKFMDGCAANDVATAVAKQLWDDMQKAQDYSFNKSHAACYALIAYRTAWLRAHHPHEYMAALISSVSSLQLIRIPTGHEQWVLRKTQVADHAAADDVLLQDALGVLRRDVLVPGAFGIDDGDGPTGADAQALDPGAIGRTVRPRKAQFLRALLDVRPSGIALIGRRAVGSGTDEQMTRDSADAERRGGRFRRTSVLLHGVLGSPAETHAPYPPVRLMT